MAKKPSLPKGFPLYAHASGQLAKKIQGKVWYFGKWEDKDAALRKYLDEKDQIIAGRNPRKMAVPKSAGRLSVADLSNIFLTEKKRLVSRGELTASTFTRYYEMCVFVCDVLGKQTAIESLGPVDFMHLRSKFPSTWSVSTCNQKIVKTRTLFKFANRNSLVERDIRFGDFRQSRMSLVRKDRITKAASSGGRLDFSADEARRLVESAIPQIRACILLGLNCGFGNTDCAKLRKSVIDFDTRWVNFPRPKTGIMRRVRLWPETIEAIQRWSLKRPDPVDEADSDLVFLTGTGRPIVWYKKMGEIVHQRNVVTARFGHLAKKIGVFRDGMNFYSLRRTFETVAGETCDQVAVDAIMGHSSGSMAEVYRQGLGGRNTSKGDERIEKVVNHVRDWLWGDAKGLA